MEHNHDQAPDASHLARGVAGAVSTLVLCATAAFTIAHHFAL